MNKIKAGKVTKTPSTNAINESGTVNPKLLKNNLQEFYSNSKEKLLQLKKDIEIITEDTEKQKEENNLLGIKYDMLQGYNNDLNLKLKGMKEKLIDVNKQKNSLAFQIRDIKREVESTSREIDTMKIENNFKLKLMQNDIDHIGTVKENNIKSVQKKIENEENYKKTLLEKITEIKAEIEKYKELIVEISSNDGKRNKTLLKETAEMTKFLSEL
jgi:chromosome segregation ATPase